MNWKTDTEFKEHKIDSVTKHKEGWDIGIGSSYCRIPETKGGPIPKKGQTIRLYPGIFGLPIRGIVVDNKVVFYRTEEEQKESQKREIQIDIEKRQKELDNTIKDRDKRWNALPPIFSERKKRFERNNPTWRRDFEPYELFVCEEAMKIANYFKTEDALNKAIENSKKNPANAEFLSWWEVCKEAGLEVDKGHSGNTMGAAGNLAHVYLKEAKYVPYIHGAMATLTGCEKYGCPPATKKEMMTLKGE